MSQSVIPKPKWIDITDQVPWHANVFIEDGKPARSLFYSPDSHTVTGYFRLDQAEVNDCPFGPKVNNKDYALPQKYRPMTTMRFAGICTKEQTSGDINDQFCQLLIQTDGTSKIQYTLNQTHYRVICNFTYPCA